MRGEMEPALTGRVIVSRQATQVPNPTESIQLVESLMIARLCRGNQSRLVFGVVTR